MPTLADPIEPEYIAAWLREHPDFFEHHRDLLADLELPHDTQGAVSLVARQVAVLRERTIDLRHRLSDLLDNARDNDKLFDKSRRLILQLIEAQDMGDIVDALYFSFSQDFDIAYTSLILFGNADSIPSSQARILSMSYARHSAGDLLKQQRALSGPLTDDELKFLFGEQASHVGSAIAVPLVHGATFGILAIGHKDAKHYRSSLGTLFLGHIADVLSRLLPKYLPR